MDIHKNECAECDFNLKYVYRVKEKKITDNKVLEANNWQHPVPGMEKDWYVCFQTQC